MRLRPIFALLIILAGALGAEQFKFMPAKVLNKQRASVAIYDANSDAIRQKYGSILGAINLTDSSEYAEAILPQDRNKILVFYCFNERCTASHGAAARAMKFGYQNVYVLEGGIVGWTKEKFDVRK